MDTSGERSHFSSMARVLASTIAFALSLSSPIMAQDTSVTKPTDAASSTSTGNTGEVRLGAYDPYGSFRNDTRVTIEHVYIPWEDIDLSTLDTADQYASERGRDILLTVEPWSWSEEWRVSPEALREGIITGEYDHLIRAVCRKSAELKSKVTIRWGHEVEIANQRYTWSYWTPSAYIAAYRYFVDRCRKYAPNVTFMWSPRGEDNLRDYYPGDEFVDSVGLSVFGLQQHDIDNYGRTLSFEELLRRSYDLVLYYDKPIYVAEHGCDGDEEYLMRCRNIQLEKIKSLFPRLEGVVYFNEVETYPWPPPYEFPDWRVSPAPLVLK